MENSDIELFNKTKIPSVGFGTWQPDPGVVGHAVAAAAIRMGYRHIDCAQVYGNEKEVISRYSRGVFL